MKIINSFFIGVVVLLSTACGSSDSFMNEINAVISENNPQYDKSLNHVVTKYIPPGTSLADAKKFLEERKFVLKEVVPERDRLKVPSGQVWYSARHKESPYLIVEKTTYIQLQTDGKDVINANGKYWFTGL